MSFRISGLASSFFQPLFELTEAELVSRAIYRQTAQLPHSAPCRISLCDAEPGEQLLLLTYPHQPAKSPYQASGPIFVRQGVTKAFDACDLLPSVFMGRLLSVRAYDRAAMISDADIVENDPRTLFDRYFADPQVDYIHVHFARRGCFACRVDRA